MMPNEIITMCMYRDLVECLNVAFRFLIQRIMRWVHHYALEKANRVRPLLKHLILVMFLANHD
jgi:hypothetical protein